MVRGVAHGVRPTFRVSSRRGSIRLLSAWPRRRARGRHSADRLRCAWPATYRAAQCGPRRPARHNRRRPARSPARRIDTAEVALSIVLLTGAGLLIPSAIALQPIGRSRFESSRGLTARFTLPEQTYTDPVREAEMLRRFGEAARRASARCCRRGGFDLRGDGIGRRHERSGSGRSRRP